MKRYFQFVVPCALGLSLMACDSLPQVVATADDIINGGTAEDKPKPLSNEEVIRGLKEALTVGTNNSTAFASKVDGFNKNERLRIPFPPEAQKVKDKATELGLGSQVEKFELTMNRAAEEAAKEAAPIFVQAVKDMTVQDGFSILKGGDNAATNFLKDKTSASLKAAFQPKVQTAIDKVQLTKYWSPIINKYNTVMTFSGGEKINPDLNDYITQRAMDGLFVLLADEEKKIRKDPVAQVTDLLKRVFGSVMGQ